MVNIKYMAGFFDGEGWCGHWIYMNQPHGETTAGIGNTNLSILKVFQKRFGGNIRQKKISKLGSKEYYEWKVLSKQARLFLKAIYPYVIEKKKKIEEIFKANKKGNIRKKVVDLK